MEVHVMERRTFMALLSDGPYDPTLGVVLRLATALGVPVTERLA